MTFKTCEKLRKSFGGESISPLRNQLFWRSSCQAYKICCALEEALPSYISELLEKLPQPPLCGKDESHSHNRVRRDLDENTNSSSTVGICLSKKDCLRFSKLMNQPYLKTEHDDCGSDSFCCALNPKYFDESFKNCSDEEGHLSVGGNSTKIDEFPWTVALQYSRSKTRI